MGAAVAVSRSELTPAQLRSAACASEEPAQVRRLLAIALVLEGMPRQQAAEQCGMDRQTLRDWVHRYNEGGVAGLRSRPCPGRAPLLTPEQKAELRALVVAGPDPARDKVVRWRCVDLRAEVARRFGVEVREGTIGGWLHQLGLTRLQPRPYHPKKDLAAQEAYKKMAFIALAVGIAYERGAVGERRDGWRGFRDLAERSCCADGSAARRGVSRPGVGRGAAQ
jgi:transposase